MSQEQAALLPQNPDLDVPEELASFYPVVASLTKCQLGILAEITSDLASGIKRTDEEIASDLGINRKTIYNARQSSAFGTALGVIVREIVKGSTDNIVSNIIEIGKGDWRADKFLLEYTGQFIQRSQQLNINARLDSQDQTQTFSEFVDEVAIKLGAAGYPIEEFVKRYHQLKAEGAF